MADENVSSEITGNGDVLEMSDGVISVGSGSPYALGKFLFGAIVKITRGLLRPPPCSRCLDEVAA